MPLALSSKPGGSIAERQQDGVLHTSPQPLHGYAASSCSMGDSGRPAGESIISGPRLPEPKSAVAIDSGRQAQCIDRMFEPPPLAIHGTQARLVDIHTTKMIDPREKAGLKRSTLLQSDRRATLIDSRFGMMRSGLLALADRYTTTAAGDKRRGMSGWPKL